MPGDDSTGDLDQSRPIVRVGGMSLSDYLAALTPEQRAVRDEQRARMPSRVMEPETEEEPILADLRAIGVEVYSVWSQFLRPEEDPAIFEVLIEHLRRGGYRSGVMQGIAFKFARKQAHPYWEELRTLYLAAAAGEYRNALASAVAQSAGKKHINQLIELVGRADLGDSRVLLMRRVKRLGDAPGLAVITGLVDHRELGREARHLLKLAPAD